MSSFAILLDALERGSNPLDPRMSLPQSRGTLKSATYRNITLAVRAISISISCAIKGRVAGRRRRRFPESKPRIPPRGTALTLRSSWYSC
jgi:hypothetical protein